MKSDAFLSVMMPVFNEERTLEIILSHVLKQPEVGEVIAIDDGSTDRTWEILSRIAKSDKRVHAFQQKKNQGKGAALRRAVAELKMPYALVQDADLEYDPVTIPASSNRCRRAAPTRSTALEVLPGRRPSASGS